MVIFDHTFNASKPIYFPQNWETGKTALELHEEWKLTLEYAIISNILQVVAASLWLLLAGLIVVACRELRRLWMLDQENRQRLTNKRYLKAEFFVPIGVVSVIWIVSTFVFLCKSEWNRLVLAKGIAAWLLISLIYLSLKKLKPLFKKWRNEKPSLPTSPIHNHNS